MEISIKSITLIGAIILTGLSAGLFYGWAVSVIPGTKRVADLPYLETMQSINRAILNPQFFLVFFGSLVLLVVCTVQQFGNGLSFWLILLALVTYLVGTVGVTGLGNVPLNDQLDALHIGELSKQDMQQWRHFYESRWNRLHTIRTVMAVLAFVLSLISLINFKSTF